MQDDEPSPGMLLSERWYTEPSSQCGLGTPCPQSGSSTSVKMSPKKYSDTLVGFLYSVLSEGLIQRKSPSVDFDTSGGSIWMEK